MEGLLHPVVGGVLVGNLLIAVGSALVGTFAVLRREAMVGDVMAHAVVPGIGVAYAIVHRAELPVLLWGAYLSVAVALMGVSLLRKESRLREDARLGIVLSVAFGGGIILLTALQRGQGVQQAALWRFLFGQAAAITWSDVGLIAGIVTLVGIFIAVAFKELVALAFDAAFLHTLPLPLRWVEFGYRIAVASVIVVGVYSVGALLMGAFLVLPPMAARFFARRVKGMVLGAAVVASVAVGIGVWLSVTFPRVATGPVIVSTAALLMGISHVVAPRRGVLSQLWYGLGRWWRNWDEDAHKVLYQIVEQDVGGRWEGWHLWAFVGRRVRYRFQAVVVVLWLWLRGSVGWSAPQCWFVTQRGRERALRVVRRHRLWELYLERVLGIAPESVHQEAEFIEHVLTPELEEHLEELLQYPQTDPHGRPIPPRQS